jgi:uncharacterized tellurite resistance protein B-like protein
MLRRIMEMFAPEPERPPAREERIRTATCVLLIEAASADDEFSSEERSHIIQTLRQRFSLSEEEAVELVQAAEDLRTNTLDHFVFTRQINEHCSLLEKERIMEEVWRVIYVDGLLEAHEDFLAHKFGRLLNLNHPQLIKAKMKVREDLKQGS